MQVIIHINKPIKKEMEKLQSITGDLLFSEFVFLSVRKWVAFFFFGFGFKTNCKKTPLNVVGGCTHRTTLQGAMST